MRKASSGIQFPFRFERLGRTGRIKFWPSRQLYGTYFRYAGAAVRNTFKTFESAHRYLEEEFTRLDSDKENSTVAHPVHSSVRVYSELEQLLRDRCGPAASLREAVEFFLANQESRQFKPKKVAECIASFHKAEARRKLSPSYTKMSKARLKRFAEDFGNKPVHTIRPAEIEEWLRPFSNPKTSNHFRGSLVSLFLYARDVLQAIPDGGKVAPQRVQPARVDRQTKVEIYSPEELATILNACVEHDVALIPPIVLVVSWAFGPTRFTVKRQDTMPSTGATSTGHAPNCMSKGRRSAA